MNVDVTIAILASVGILLALLVITIGLLVYGHKKFRIQPRAVILGAIIWTVFVLLLETNLLGLFFQAFPGVVSNTVLMVVLGALAAGLFEETGRLLAMKLLLRGNKTRRGLGLGFGYGIGHGCGEAILLVGTGALSTLLFAVSLSAIGPEALIAAVPAEQQPAIQLLIANIQVVDPLISVFSVAERAMAVTFHIAASILIWMVARRALGMIWYAVAILLHALTNVGAALNQMGVWALPTTEACTLVAVILVVLLVRYLYKKHGVALRDDQAPADENAVAAAPVTPSTPGMPVAPVTADVPAMPAAPSTADAASITSVTSADASDEGQLQQPVQ